MKKKIILYDEDEIFSRSGVCNKQHKWMPLQPLYEQMGQKCKVQSLIEFKIHMKFMEL